MSENIKVTTSGQRAKTVVSQPGTVVTSVSAASRIKVGNLEDNVGNIDTSEGSAGLVSGVTIVYNADTKKWVATSIADTVDTQVDEALSTLSLDGGTF